jgi:NAD(P)-dependent dehydrogenase (short-subunit alcohol dehydrogenase family)
MNFKNKTVLVTGANRGIGRALVFALLNEGVKKIYATARNIEKLSFYTDARVVKLELDICDQDSVERAAQTARDINVLINNAGILTFKSIFKGDIADFENDMRTNYIGLVRMMQAFVPVLKKAKEGAVMANVASIASFINFPFHGGYCASKAAAYSITQGARIELAQHGIKVHSINPGPIDTDMGRNLDIDKTQPEDTAKAILEGLTKGVEDIFPDPIGAEMFETWKKDHKALEVVAANFLAEL